MRILSVLLHDGIGGMETLVRALDREFAGAGHTTRIHVLDPPAGSRARRVRRLLTLRRVVAATAPDVVIAHSALPNLYTRLVLRGRIPTVTVLHSGGDDFANRRLRWAERLLLRYSAAVVAVAAKVRRQYLEYFPQASTKTVVIPNGIRRDLPFTGDAPSGPVHLLAVSRLVETKEISTLLAALGALMARNVTDFRLDIAGDGPDPVYAGTLLAQAEKDPGVRERVHFLGRVEDVGPLLAGASLLVHPSRVEAHQSIAVLEAAAVGLPVLVADVVASTLEPDVVHRSFPTGDAAALADALAEIWPDLGRLRAAARRVAPQVRQTHSVATCADAYLRLMSDVTRAGDRSAPVRQP